SDFSPKQEVYVTASDFPDPYAIDHTFYVRARNEFGSIDTIGFFTRVIRASNGDSLGLDTVRASRTFHTIYPTFVPPFNSKRILIIDNNYSDTARASASHPTREMIDNYYTGILDDLGRSGQYDITLVIDPPPFQPKYVTYSDLGKYSLVIFVADGVDGFFNNHHYSTFSRQQILFNYCAVGGKLIMSGWSWRSPLNSQLTTFYTDIIHVGTRGVINGAKDFLGVRGQQGYPDAYLDPAKLDTAWGGTLSNTYLSYPYGFGEFVQNFDSKKDSILFENQPMAVRYIGVTFNTVYFSFPLYFIDRPSTVSILRKALQDIGE
ncbi:MAG: hypothetical protein HY277_00805, partial [Ignavibacteriales bacterium]|nr:hypothetical protein [Ignavibacteriales bacterium]